MDEQFLHYIWKFQKFTGLLSTVDGERVTVFQPGNHNHNSGPDFEEARIKIGKVEWAGQVEIHVKASDWNTHKHHTDPAYENVILHVVWEANYLLEGVPTIEIKDYVSADLSVKYQSYINQKDKLLCSSHFSKISDLTVNSMIDKALFERLQSKASKVLERLKHTNNDWEEVTYRILASSFGFSVNKNAFETLSQLLPFQILQKNQNKELAIYALIFGSAGLISGDSSYANHLRNEFEFLKNKYQLKSIMKRSEWKFSRMRPPNFPTVRLAQFAAMLSANSSLFSKIIQLKSAKEAIQLFDFQVSAYWKDHYDFDEELTQNFSFGHNSKLTIIINAFVPLMVAYGRIMGDDSLLLTAENILLALPSEKNTIIRRFEDLKKSKTAFDSQGLIQLYRRYCSEKKCLSCSIGVTIMSK